MNTTECQEDHCYSQNFVTTLLMTRCPAFLVWLPLLFIGTAQAKAQTMNVLHNFGGYPDDGAYPYAVPIFDAKGVLYGTTATGGTDDHGMVYALTPSGAENILYAFTGGSDRTNPIGMLTSDRKGNLYGTTAGGTQAGGTVFLLTPSGTEITLHTFTGSPDGAYVLAGLTWNRGGLYGTTQFGGDAGTVFEMRAHRDEKVIHSFLGAPSDGASPLASLVHDSNGNLYGTTFGGGSAGQGTVFEITTDGQEKILYSFAGGVDGFWPQGPLVLDSAGNLYGTTGGGGENGSGTVFELTTTGSKTVLYGFTGGDDGGTPAGNLVRDNNGNFYGTTFYGGNPACSLGCGVVFEVTPEGTETVLHTFISSDGANPSGGVMLGPNGGLYGTTRYGGSFGYGTVFEVTP